MKIETKSDFEKGLKIRFGIIFGQNLEDGIDTLDLI